MVSVNQRVGRCAAVALVLVLAGCTPRPAPSPSAATPPVSLRSPSPPPSPTDPRVGAVQTAVAAYRGMWQAYETVAQNPDPTQPELTRYAASTALQTITTGLKSLKDQGLKGTGSVVHSPQVTQISPVDAPTEIAISDCMDTSASRIVRAGPGPAYSDSTGGRRLCFATVQRQNDGSWKVTSFGVRAVGTC
jgi:hypothetical protein